MASSATSKSGSQNNSERLSSNNTSTAACSDCPQQCWIVPSIPANSAFQCPSLTRTIVPLRASYHLIRFTANLCTRRLRRPPDQRPVILSRGLDEALFRGTPSAESGHEGTVTPAHHDYVGVGFVKV